MKLITQEINGNIIKDATKKLRDTNSIFGNNLCRKIEPE